MNINYKGATVRIIPEVYEPSDDSFLLAEAALSEIRNSEKVLEIGCGSGIISAVIKTNTRAQIIGIDISPYAVNCSKDNGVDVIRGDLLSSIKGKFDMIIFNPPYLPTEEGERTGDWLNVAIDGGSDGRQIINRFLEDVNDHLVDNGRILMLISSLTGIDVVKSKLISLNFVIKDIVQERYMFEQLKVIVATKLSSN